MSKERARRRADREAAAAAARRERERQAARSRRAATLRDAVTAPLRLLRGAGGAGGRPETALGRRRSRENGALAAALLGAHAALWLLVPSWWVRIGALVLTVMAWPLLVVLLFDRRPSS